MPPLGYGSRGRLTGFEDDPKKRIPGHCDFFVAVAREMISPVGHEHPTADSAEKVSHSLSLHHELSRGGIDFGLRVGVVRDAFDHRGLSVRHCHWGGEDQALWNAVLA